MRLCAFGHSKERMEIFVFLMWDKNANLSQLSLAFIFRCYITIGEIISWLMPLTFILIYILTCFTLIAEYFLINNKFFISNTVYLVVVHLKLTDKKAEHVFI